MRNVEGKVAWITGGGTGIGKGAAIALANAGMTVVVSGRRSEPLDATVKEIADAGGRADAIAVDVADSSSVADAADRIHDAHGRVDVLVHSAGINRLNRSWGDTEREDWDSVIRVNVDGAYHCCRAVLPGMREQQDGLIINISSWAGRRVSRIAGVAYSASKSALNSMTEMINLEECVNGIRACAISPGEVSTEILDKRPVPVSAEDRAKMIQPEDMGDVILFLCRLPAHVCINDMLISPTWNRAYVVSSQQ